MKQCPNCHTQLADNIKYCTNCGQFVGDISPQSTATSKSATVEPRVQPVAQNNVAQQANSAAPDFNRARILSQNYFQNLLLSWQHPNRFNAPTQQRYFGITSFIIIALLNTLTLWGVIANAGRLLTALITNLSTIFDPTSTESFSVTQQQTVQQEINRVISQYTSGVYFKFFLMTLIVFIFFIGCGYLVKRYLIGDETVALFDYINEYAHYINGMIVLSALTFLLALLGIAATYKIIFFLIIVGSVLFNVGFFMATSSGLERRFDKIYSLVIAQIILNFLIILFTRVTLTNFIQSLSTSGLSNFLGNY